MEKYLTPIQYDQYLHDKAYQAAMSQTTPSVTLVFGMIAIFAIALLVWTLLKAHLEKKHRREADLKREVERHIEPVIDASVLRATAQKQDAAWAKAGGSKE